VAVAAILVLLSRKTSWRRSRMLPTTAAIEEDPMMRQQGRLPVDEFVQTSRSRACSERRIIRPTPGACSTAHRSNRPMLDRSAVGTTFILIQ